MKSIAAGKAEALKDIPILPQMSPTEIDETLAVALKKNRRVSVQLNQKDQFGRQTEAVEGFFKGYCDEDEILIGEEWVALDRIRNVHILDADKWSRVAVFKQNQY